MKSVSIGQWQPANKITKIINNRNIVQFIVKWISCCASIPAARNPGPIDNYKLFQQKL